MRRTYAPFCSALGLVLGAMVGVKWTNNTALGIVIGVVFAIIAFVIVKAFENAVYKAGDKLADKASEALQKRREQKSMNDADYHRSDDSQVTKFPGSED